MKYLGSKNRISEKLLNIILPYRNGRTWVEPFVGGANMIDKIDGFRIGSDANKYIIALLVEMCKPEYKSPTITEQEYAEIKNNREIYPTWLVGYAGSQLSFGATWFGSYRKDSKGLRNYSKEARKNVDAQSKNLQGIQFYCCSYDKLEIPSNSLIYCDPPYDTQATKGKYSSSFDSMLFWEWVRKMVVAGHLVFVSEYNAPEDFECILEIPTLQKMNNAAKTSAGVERLFVMKGMLDNAKPTKA